MEKGFTLVELLAVIIIILTITIIVTFAVSTLVSNSKEKIDNVQNQIIIDAAGMWLIDNMDKYTSNNMCLYITLDELYKYGYIDNDAFTQYFSVSDEEYENTKVRIDLINDKKYDITITDDLSNCNSAYE